MTEGTRFYQSCIKAEVQPGFIADSVRRGGAAISATGNILDNAGHILTQYGYGSVAFATALAGSVALDRPAFTHLYDSIRNWGVEDKEKITTNPGTSWITPFATDRLKETGIGLGVGLGLSVISKPVKLLGNLLQTRNTLCRIGETLDYGMLNMFTDL